MKSLDYGQSGQPLAPKYHYEASAAVAAPAEEIFNHLDDQLRLSAHMTKSSWMMGGGRMAIDFDAAQGRSVGSIIRMSGTVLGIHLALEEVVIERNPPHRKAWETIGTPRLLIIGGYRMGFEITGDDDHSALRVFIDYALPQGPVTRWLGCLFGSYYARWCTKRMVNDAVEHFNKKGATEGKLTGSSPCAEGRQKVSN